MTGATNQQNKNMQTEQKTPKQPTIPNYCEKPPIIFDSLTLPQYERVRQFRKYYKEGPPIPLSYYFPPDSNEAVERGADVMRVLWNAYYEQVGPER